MNHFYRTVWSEISHSFVAVSEIVKGRGKHSSRAVVCVGETPEAPENVCPVKPKFHRARPAILRLEPRLMFDGAAVGSTIDALAGAMAEVLPPVDAAPARLADALPPAVTPARVVDPLPPASAPAATAQAAAPSAEWVPPFEVSSDPTHQVIVIDASVPYANDIIAGIPPGWTVIRLSANRDGLTQILDALAGRTDLSAIHIFSHGGEGRLTLGSFDLTTSQLNNRAADLARLGASLTRTGDLMLYGCNVAADFAGQEFINRLAALTQADVAASNDATGAVTMGGDWQLEMTTGTIDTSSVTPEQYPATLGNLSMATGQASGSSAINIGQSAPRLYWQASGPTGYGRANDAVWVDQYTTNQRVSYWGTAWASISYPVFRWDWLPWRIETVWFSYPYVAEWNYGAGTRYGTATVTIANDSAYQFDIATNNLYKDNHGEITSGFLARTNAALYKGSFDPSDPLKNLLTASEATPWDGGLKLQSGNLSAGTYTVVVSFDTNRWFIGADNNVWHSYLNDYAEQLWGNFTLNVANLNRAPQWTTRDLSQVLDGAGVQSFSIPWSLAGNQTLTDPDGDPMTVTASLSDGSALPAWLTFNANNLSFTGNPPANTGTLTVRLSANDGQLTSTRDFTITYTNDNDRPVLAAAIPDQHWEGEGSFSYTIPTGTFTDSDPGSTHFTYSAVLADGSALPDWLTLNPGTGTLSGNPPANASDLHIKITVDDGSGQANATQNDTFVLSLANNNDIPAITSISKTLVEDNTLSLSADDFIFTDGDTHASDGSTAGSGKSMASVRILHLPANGTLWLDLNSDDIRDGGEIVQINQVIAYASLGLLRYTPNADWAGTAILDRSNAPDSFTWTATDGVNDAPTPATVALNVTLVNDAPTLTLSEGRALTIRATAGSALSTPVLVDPGLIVSDADALYTSDSAYDTIYSAVVTVYDNVSKAFQSGDALTATAANGIAVSYNSSTGVLTLTGAAKAADYQAVLRTLTFSSSNTSNDNLREVSVVLRTGDVGSKTSAVFDGLNDYVETQRAAIPLAGDYTLSVWAKLDLTPASVPDGGQYTVLAQGSNTSNNFFIQLNRVGSNYNLRLGNSWTVSNGYPMDGKWHQFTVVKNGDSGTNGTLYIDGVKTSTGILTGVEGSGLRIGRFSRLNNILDADAYWQGSISDLRIYDRSLSVPEVIASLDGEAVLSGYEPGLTSWYPLVSDFDNHAVTTWDLGRDYNPLSSSLTQGPWSLGVSTGDASNGDNFPAGAFQAFTSANTKVTLSDESVRLDNTDFPYGNTANGWGRMIIPAANSGRFVSGAYSLEPGAIQLLPGSINPVAVQFAAPVAGVYAVDARFWSAFSDKSSNWPLYKIFRVDANGSVSELSGAGGTVSGTSASTAGRSGLQQVQLNTGEKLIFAVQKGSGSVDFDEVNSILRCDLLAVKTAGGYFYSLEDGHYYGVSNASAATWDAAKSAAEALSTAGQTGYLATPGSSSAMKISAALAQRAYEAGAGSSFWAGFRQIATSSEPGGNWFWMAGPESGTPFAGTWLTGQPDNAGGTENYGSMSIPAGRFSDLPNAYANTRYLIEFGSSMLAMPTELTTVIGANSVPGNALVFSEAGIAWSARTGHYYDLNAAAADYNTASAAAAATSLAGQSGYLARLTTIDELRTAGLLTRLDNSSGAWVGLQNTDPASNGQMVWRWSNDTLYDGSFSRADIPVPPAGQVLVAFDDFEHGATGWVENSNGNTMWLNNDGSGNHVLGLYGGTNGDKYIRKSFQLNNAATTITFTMNRVDSWDTENFYVRLSGDSFTGYDTLAVPLVFSTNNSSVTPTLVSAQSGKLSLSNFSVTPVANYGNFTGVAWPDQSYRYTITLPANYASNIVLSFGSSLDSASTDEAFSIDNLAFYQAAAVGVNTNAHVGGTLDTFTGHAIGWDNNGEVDGPASSNWGSYASIGGNNALNFYSGNPAKTFVIDNQATRLEFDLYTLDSWDNESIGIAINGTFVAGFNRTVFVEITQTLAGTATVNGKVVSYTITPGVFGNFFDGGNNQPNWDEQKFHVVIDLPADFGTTFQMHLDNNLNEGISNESAAIDNVQVYSLDNAGWVDARGVLNTDANLAQDLVKLEQFRSFNLYHNTGGWATDAGWADISGLATDGRYIYVSYPTLNIIRKYDMNGVAVQDINVSSSILGPQSNELTYSAGWLYLRYSNSTATASDDKIYRISPLDGNVTQVTVDATNTGHPLQDGNAWGYGSLFSLPDGRLGSLHAVLATGEANLRLYTPVANGSELVWERDISLNLGANWLSDLHGCTSDGRYLYILRGSISGYKVFDISNGSSGSLVYDGSAFTLVRDGVDNPTWLTRDPLTGDIYFADYLGSHIARSPQPMGATHQMLVEYGSEGSALPAPLFATTLTALPDRFVSDTRDIQVRLGNTAPTVTDWSASTQEDTPLALPRSLFAAHFNDAELDSLYSITLQSVPSAGSGSLSLNGVTLTAGAVVYAGDLDALVFTPAANFNGAASFTYRASDGNLSSAAAATVSLNIAAVNDAPLLAVTGSPALAAIVEDVSSASNTGTTVAALVLDGSITDVDAAAPEAIAVTRVDNTHGVWQYQSGGVWLAFTATTGGIVDLGAAARLLDSADLIRFVPNTNFNGTANIHFRAWDKSSGSAGGSTDPNALGGNSSVSTAEMSASISVTPVNDLPTSANATISMDEDTVYTFHADDFSFDDVDAGDTLQSVRITTLPTAGTLFLNHVAINSNDVVVLKSDLAAGNLTFAPLADVFGDAYASLTFAVGDGSGFDATPRTLTFNVTDTNDAPSDIAWSTGGSVAENSSEGTVVGRFGASDPNPGDSFRFQRVSNSNFNVAPDGTLTVSALGVANGLLNYELATTQTVRVRVTDAGGLSFEKDMTVTLLDVTESAPSLTTNSFYIAKGATVTLTENQLKAVDAQQSAGQLVYTVLEAPAGGSFWIDANDDGFINAGEVALAPISDGNPNGIDTFTQADVLAGKLKFIKDSAEINGKLSLRLSDGTEEVTGTVVGIVSSPPVVNPVDDQQWSLTGIQTFTLPGNTFTDPDFDLISVTATQADGSPLPNWLLFDTDTWTFSGTPTGYSNGQFIDIKIIGTDGHNTPVEDSFRIEFSNTVTKPSVTTPIPNHIFDGSGSKIYTFDADTFSAQPGYAITGYKATLADGSALPDWLSFDANTRTFSGNPPQSAEPGPYWIKVNADTASGGSSSTSFRLSVFNANDMPVEAAPVDTAIPDRTISDALEHTYIIPSSAFTDGDHDNLTLRAGNLDGSPLPSWVRFIFDADTGLGHFTAKAPAGSGALTVRIFADDGNGSTGYADFILTYSGGANLAPKVMTSDGLWYMDAHPQLAVSDSVKATPFSVAQGTSGAITNAHLKEMDPDDDGGDLTYTLSRLPDYGQLWLDADGDGTINGAESTLNIGSTFTQADIDAGRLRYQHTGPTSATTAVNDNFVFNLADGGENGALAVTGVTFKIVATPLPAAPVLMDVLRVAPVNALTNADSVVFDIVFSEAVKGVEVTDFVATGDLASLATVESVSVVSGKRYQVTLSGSGLANANGTLGVKLATGFGISNKVGTVAVDPTHETALLDNETYILENVAPTVAISAPTLHDGTSFFYVTLDFSEAINDLALSDLTASNATLSDLQRIDLNLDPDVAPAGNDPSVTLTPTGNRYRVKVTPSNGNDIVIGMAAGGVSDAAGNVNAAATPVTVTRNSLPTVILNASGATANLAGVYSEIDGADSTANDLAFSTAGTSLADANAGQNLAALSIGFASAAMTDGASEWLLVSGATSGGSIQLDFVDGAAIADVALNGVSYAVHASVTGGHSILSFARSGGGTLSLSDAENLLDALRYNNSSDTPHAGSRVFQVMANDGLQNSAAALFTVTVVATNDTPLIYSGTDDRDSAALSESNARLTTSGTLSVLDRDLTNTVSVSTHGVTASGLSNRFAGTDDAALLAMLTLDAGNVVSDSATTGTIHWAFDSGAEVFNDLAAGEVLTLTYTIRATDSDPAAATDDQTLVITITGTNDAPQITSSTVTTLFETAMSATGVIAFNDQDATDRPTASFTPGAGSVSVDAVLSGGGTLNLHADTVAAIQSALTLPVPAGNSNSGNIDWSFNLDPALLKDANDAVIAVGDKITVLYTVTLDDQHGGTNSQELKFTIIGSGGGGVLTVAGDAGSIVEGAPATLSDAGALTFAPAVASVNHSTLSVSDPASGALSAGNKTAIEAGFQVVQAGAANAVAWSYAVSEATLDFLAAGDTITAVFQVAINGGVETQNVTIVINGTNDAPFITSTVSAAEGNVVEFGDGVAGTPTATGMLTASDVDTGATKIWSGDASGMYGAFVIDPTSGAWTYTLDNDKAETRALAAGQTAVDTFTATVSDGAGGSATQLVRITVMGSNDAPVLNAPGTIVTYTDSAVDDTFAHAAGTLSASDDDAGDNQTFSIDGQSPDTNHAGFTHSKTGSFGTLYLNALTGAYDYVPDNDKVNAATGSAQDDFTVVVTDDLGATHSQSLRVTIAGNNDAPTIITGSGSDTAALYETNSTLSSSGLLTVRDADLSDIVTGSVVSVVESGAASGLSNDALKAMLSVTGTVLDNSHSSAPLTWNFNSGGDYFDHLRAGETLTLLYTVRVDDGTVAADKSVTVTIAGTNDAPLISLTGGDSQTATLAENNLAVLTADGTLTVGDMEGGDTVTAAVSGVIVGGSAPRAASPNDDDLLAMLSLTPTSLLTDGVATTASHGLTWHFNSGAVSAFDKLAAGESVLLTYAVRATDNAPGAPGMDTETITVTITGDNDAPTITVGDVSGQIASGFPAQLFDSGSIVFGDPDYSDRPTASITSTTIQGTLRGGTLGSLTLSSAQQLAIANAFSISPAAGNAQEGTVNWNYTINQSDIDFLGSGQSVTAVFTLSVDDQHGGVATQDVTLTLGGKNNTPVISIGIGDADHAGVNETDSPLTVSNTLTVSDSNTTDIVTAAVSNGTIQRNSGAISAMDGNQLSWLSVGPSPVVDDAHSTGPLTWTFNSGSESFNYLADGETLTLIYTIDVVDDAPTPAHATKTVTITLTGSNDQPVLAAIAPLTITDTVANDDFADIDGTLGSSDIDSGDTRTYAIAGQSADSSLSGFTHSLAGTYGHLYLNSITGAYRFVADNAAIQARQTDSSESFTLITTDAGTLSDAKTLTVNIIGANDAPVISLGVLDVAAENISESNAGGLSRSGTLTVGDRDADTVTASVTGLIASGATGGMSSNHADLLSMLTLNDSTVLSGGSSSGQIVWAFNSGPETFAHLADNETLTLTYTIVATDGAASSSRDVVITVTGTNDAPLITAQDVNASIVEDGAHIDSGSITFTDLDFTNRPTAHVALNTVSGLASDATTPLMLSSNQIQAIAAAISLPSVAGNTNNGTVIWDYSIAESDIDFLAQGEQVTAVFTITVDDGYGQTATQDITIRIDGCNDTPVAVDDNGVAQEAGGVANGDGGQNGSGTLLTNDSDVDGGDSLSVSAIRTGGVEGGGVAGVLGQALVGQYGQLTVTADGHYSYVVDQQSAAVQALQDGESLSDVFNYSVTDAHGLSDSAVLTIQIAGQNDAPLATDDSGTAQEAGAVANGDGGQNGSGTLLANDSDVDGGDSLSVSAIRTGGVAGSGVAGILGQALVGQYGQLTVTADGHYSYVVDQQSAAVQALQDGESLSDVFNYTVSDAHGLSDTAVLSLRIDGRNDTPVAVDDNGTAQEAGGVANGDGGQNGSGTLLANDSDVDGGDSLSVSAIRTGGVEGSGVAGVLGQALVGQYGQLTVTADGHYSYVVDQQSAAVQALQDGESLSDVFNYTVSDAHGLSDSAVLTIQIAGQNDAPLATDDSGTAQEAGAVANGDGGQNGSGTLLANDSDVDGGETLTLSAIRTGGVEGSGVAGVLGQALSGQYGQLTVTADGHYSYVVDQQSAAVQALQDGESLHDVFNYTVTDTHGLSDNAVLTIHIAGQNDAPLATDDSGTAQEAGGVANGDGGQNGSGTLLTNDSDVDGGDSLSVSAIRTGGVAGGGVAGVLGQALVGQYGQLTVTADGHYSYVVDQQSAAVQALQDGESLHDVFNYSVTDTHGLSDNAVLTIHIAGQNDAPLATDDSGTAQEAGGVANGDGGQNGSGTLLANDSDVDGGETLTLSAIRTGGVEGSGVAGVLGQALSGQYGQLTVAADGHYSYILDQQSAAVQALQDGESLSDVFNYSVTDTHGLSDTAVLSLRIDGRNDTPVAVDDNGVAQEAGGVANGDGGQNGSGMLLTNDSDVDGDDSLSVSAIRTGGVEGGGVAGVLGEALVGQYGQLTFTADGHYSYVVDQQSAAVQALQSGESLTERFNYTVIDAHGLSDTAVLTIRINGRNDTPILVSPIATPAPALVGVAYSLQLPTAINGVFADVDRNDVLTFSATLTDGRPLPSWLQFNPATLEFSGTPTTNQDSGLLSVRVKVTDSHGAQADTTFDLSVVPASPPSVNVVAQPVSTPSVPVVPTAPVSEPVPDPAPMEFASAAGVLAAPATTTTTSNGLAVPAISEVAPGVQVGVVSPMSIVATASRSSDILLPNAPLRNTEIQEGSRIDVQISADAFIHSNPRATVTLSSTLLDGSPLPGWLHFTAKNARFMGTPPPGFKGVIMIKVIARDSNGLEAAQIFKIIVGERGQGTVERSDASPVFMPGRDLERKIATLAGHPGLSDQLQHASRAGLSPRLTLISRHAQTSMRRIT